MPDILLQSILEVRAANHHPREVHLPCSKQTAPEHLLDTPAPPPQAGSLQASLTRFSLLSHSSAASVSALLPHPTRTPGSFTELNNSHVQTGHNVVQLRKAYREKFGEINPVSIR